jgi:hypothetical protein
VNTTEWKVELHYRDALAARFHANTGIKAFQIAREWYRSPRLVGDVFVWSPKADVWEIKDNGMTRVGF